LKASKIIESIINTATKADRQEIKNYCAYVIYCDACEGEGCLAQDIFDAEVDPDGVTKYEPEYSQKKEVYTTCVSLMKLIDKSYDIKEFMGECIDSSSFDAPF